MATAATGGALKTKMAVSARGTGSAPIRSDRAVAAAQPCRGSQTVGPRAPTAMAELVGQVSRVAAASVVGEPAATLVPEALPAKTTSICGTTPATVQLAVPYCRERLNMKWARGCDTAATGP